MKLVAGSYERFLLGYSLKKGPVAQAVSSPEADAPGEEAVRAEKSLSLVPAFTYAGHLGPIKCLAASGSVLVSGGSDDVIRVYDLQASKDMGSLLQHEGAVTCLKFFGPRGHPTHLFSGSADSRICVWDTDTWTHLQTLKGHRGAVNDLTVHPSGRLGLSVSRDQTLRMWDLIKGRCTFSTRLQEEGDLVSFMPEEGKQYALVSGQSVGVFNAETGKEERALAHNKRVLCLSQPNDNVIVTGGETGFISFWDVTSGKPVLEWPSAHGNRVRGLAVGGGSSSSAPTTPSPQTLPVRLASASSDGMIRVWDPRRVGGSGGAIPLTEVQTRGRLTCLVWAGAPPSLPTQGRSSKKGVDTQVASADDKGHYQEQGLGGEDSEVVRGDAKNHSNKVVVKKKKLDSMGTKVGKKRKNDHVT